MYTRLTTIMTILLLAFSGLVSAENATRTGGYTIHHNAISTDNLSQQVAKGYGIKRSKSRGLINISIIKDVANTTGTAVSAAVNVQSRNLFGHIRGIPVREIREGNAIYYIGEFPVAHRERLMFDINVLPVGSNFPLRAHMQQEFFID